MISLRKDYLFSYESDSSRNISRCYCYSFCICWNCHYAYWGFQAILEIHLSYFAYLSGSYRSYCTFWCIQDIYRLYSIEEKSNNYNRTNRFLVSHSLNYILFFLVLFPCKSESSVSQMSVNPHSSMHSPSHMLPRQRISHSVPSNQILVS